MSGTWWAKFILLVASCALAIYLLLPNLLGERALERLSDQAAALEEGEEAEDEASDAPWYSAYIPSSRFVLGLDLQGGIDLTLQVETKEAVISTIQRDLQPLRDSASNEGIAITDALRDRDQAAILIRIPPDADLEILKNYMRTRFGSYSYVGAKDVDGATYQVFALLEDVQKHIGDRAVEQALETLRTRVNETGVKEPSIMLKGNGRINVQLPGIDNLQQAYDAIGTAAVLEFMLVDEEVSESEIERALLEAKKQLDPATFKKDGELSEWLLRTKRIPSGDRLIWQYEKNPEGKDVRSSPMVIHDEIMLTGDDINDARVGMNQFNEPYVSLDFKPRGGRIFADVTGKNVGKRFAIVLDGKLRSAPVIRERIGGGRASIEMGAGNYDQLLREANVLSLVLRTGALPAPVTVGSANVVGATLGADTIRQGVIACLVGGALVLLFMWVYYRKLGSVANLCVAMNALFLFAMMALLNATLTLPGIAGIALTVGMAVDCNIIIYERIREELALGRNARSATDAGFDKAYSAVLDANITTFIAGVVLYSYGTGPIKGFAVTLMVGILSTLYSGVFASRVFMDWLTRKTNARLVF